jgi:hypothetical protein
MLYAILYIVLPLFTYCHHVRAIPGGGSHRFHTAQWETFCATLGVPQKARLRQMGSRDQQGELVALLVMRVCNMATL